MPTISVKRDLLFQSIGKTFTDDEFDELCFEFGIELDEVTTESKLASKFRGDAADQQAKAGKEDEEVVYRVDIPANRYDLLCLEGLARALRVFLQIGEAPKYQVIKPSGAMQQIIVHKETSEIREFVVGAVLRNVKLDSTSYNSLIELQDKLHQNICRKRTLVAIGTHNLDVIKGPFHYEARVPTDIKFTPLSQKQEYTAVELMSLYQGESHLRQYLPIIQDKPRYPVIYDSNGAVLSMPPIINGDLSKITVDTKNIFIECTATDHTKALIVLDILVTMFSQYCSEPFTVEPVEVVYPDGHKDITPKLAYRMENVKVDDINIKIGVKLEADKIASLLTRMGLRATAAADKKSVSVEVPPTRADVIHPIDVIEDVAIGYGYNNIAKTIPNTNTIARQLPVNKLTDLLRLEMALASFTEILTFSLCSIDENFAHLKRPNDGSGCIIANPQTQEFQIVRTSLLPGMLKTISSNMNVELPIKVFEISDIVVRDAASDTGAKNHRHLCAATASTSSELEIVHGLLDRAMQMLNVPFVEAGASNGYYLRAGSSPTFIAGQCAEVIYNGAKIGELGVLSPEVVTAFEINYPISFFEITVEPFV